MRAKTFHESMPRHVLKYQAAFTRMHPSHRTDWQHLNPHATIKMIKSYNFEFLRDKQDSIVTKPGNFTNFAV